MMPIASYFVIGPRKISCCSKRKYLKDELGVSKKLTAINMALTLLIYVDFISYVYSVLHPSDYLFHDLLTISFYYTYRLSTPFISMLILNLVCNIIFLLLDENCCCARSQNCFCLSCCSPNCFKHEIHFIDIKTDNLDSVKIENRFD